MENNESELQPVYEVKPVEAFSSSFLAGLTPLQNKKIMSVIEDFMGTLSARLSVFIGKKIEIEFNEMQHIETKKAFETPDKTISSFAIAQENDLGVIVFDTPFCNFAIDVLFGFDGNHNSQTTILLGKCGLKVVKKISEMTLIGFKEAISPDLAFDAQVLKTSQNMREMNIQSFPEKTYQLSFKINCLQLTHHLKLFLPEPIIETVAFQNKLMANDQMAAQQEQSRENLRKEVIDSSISLVATLPEMKLKLADVVNLKPGDLIPISDPAQVELRVGNRKVYKALVGKEDTVRVVKIIEKISQTMDVNGVI